jgi:four helix bundle protein
VSALHAEGHWFEPSTAHVRSVISHKSIVIRKVTKIKTFKDLEVWKKSFSFAAETIRLTERLPRRTSIRIVLEQLLRASTSISANIAEGYGSFSNKEFARYLRIALKSSYETDNWLNLLHESFSTDIGAEDNEITRLEKLNTEIIKMLIVLHKKVGSSSKQK